MNKIIDIIINIITPIAEFINKYKGIFYFIAIILAMIGPIILLFKLVIWLIAYWI